jgi:hypothetical protein
VLPQKTLAAGDRDSFILHFYFFQRI